MRNIFAGFKKSQVSSAFLALVLLVLLAGCSGGGGDANSWTDGTASSGNTTGGSETTASIQLLVSSPQMMSAGATPIDLTAVVLNSQGQAMAGRTVVFSREGESSAYFSDISNGSVSTTNGVVTAKLNLGTDKANRVIAIRATSDTASATNTVEVAGTTVSISGSSSIAFGDSTQLIVSVKDSAGMALSNTPVTVISQNGNAVVLPTDATSGASKNTTDASGSLVVTVTASKTGNDLLTASAAGASKTQVLTVSSANFAFTAPLPVSPLTTPQIQLNTPTPVSAKWLNSGAAVAGSLVTFSTSRGTITNNPALTDTNGVATVAISSTSSGPATITAFGPGGSPSATMTALFVSTTAVNSITAQATPNNVKPTTTAVGQTDNLSTISVIVRDLANNLVKDARVMFNIVTDPTGGTLAAVTAVTDVSGTASVNYISGQASSAQNGVIIRAIVYDVNGIALPTTPVIAAETTLTVGGSALFVRLGTDASVSSQPPNLTKTYSALVTDSSGNPAPFGSQVRFVIRPYRYGKGYYSLPIAPENLDFWQQRPATDCANEDSNFNGIVDAYEDGNDNGRLDPGNVASVNPTATTDANGFAMATITYAKNFASWTEVTLEARAGTVGNDPPNTVVFFLPGLGGDYSVDNPTVPGAISPFGASSDCANPN